jgi:MFS family permease
VIGLLAKETAVARPGYNRWLTPAAALAVHLCIGQVYALSVFYGPLSHLIGGTRPAPGDWTEAQLGWIFTVAIVTLGLSTALAARWLDRAGPRAVIFVAACCFGGGFLVSALGVRLHQIPLLFLGSGVLGGIGLGLGYVGPISPLVQFFPERRGLATGLAIMGFGGGAMIAAPLSTFLVARLGVAETFVVMGVIYFVVMAIGTFAIRAPGLAEVPRPAAMEASMTVEAAVRTPEFYLLWVMLAVNVVAGIGVLGQASEILSQKLGAMATPAAIAGFVGLLSLFNMAGRIVFASASDYLGRRTTYSILLFASAVLYAIAPFVGAHVSVAVFALQYAVMMSFYGGGFATIPAYIADCFGPRFVGGIHGRILTAWSAGVLGSVALDMFRDHQIAGGVARAAAQASTMHIMGGLLLVGLVCNLMITAGPPAQGAPPDAAEAGPWAALPRRVQWRGRAPLIIVWLLIGASIAWGVSETMAQASQLELSWRLALTLLPLVLGVVVTVVFHYLDNSRFAVRGVGASYFAAVALLFALYASLMATEVWQRAVRTTSMAHTEITALDAAVRIGEALHPQDPRVRRAAQAELAAASLDGVRIAPAGSVDPQQGLYAIAVDKAFFQGAPAANTAFFQAIREAHAASQERHTLLEARLGREKLFSLLLFGLLTQVAIAFCQAGNIRAIGVTVMLFSVAFAASVGILELMDNGLTMARAPAAVFAPSTPMKESIPLGSTN